MTDSDSGLGRLQVIDGQTPDDALHGLVARPITMSSLPLADDEDLEEEEFPFAEGDLQSVDEPKIDSLGLW